jgi:hypothetical protein
MSDLPLETQADGLINSLPGPVPADVLKGFLFSPRDPASGMPTQRDPAIPPYDPASVTSILGIAEKNVATYRSLSAHDPQFLITSGGGPGGGKTTALLQMIAALLEVKNIPAEAWLEPSLDKVLKRILPALPGIWISPDHGGLQQLAELILGAPLSNQEFYLAWRAGSNFLSNIAQNAMHALGLSGFHDTTLGSAHSLGNIKKVFDKGGAVVAMVQASSLPTRSAATEIRNAAYFQSLAANEREQEEKFGENIPKILENSHLTILSWRDAANEASRPVAALKKDGQKSELHIFDMKGFLSFAALHTVFMNTVKDQVTILRKPGTGETPGEPVAVILNNKKLVIIDQAGYIANITTFYKQNPAFFGGKMDVCGHQDYNEDPEFAGNRFAACRPLIRLLKETLPMLKAA